MALRRGREPSADLEALAWLSQFGAPQEGAKANIQDLRQKQAIIARLSSGLDKSLANHARLHGWRVQHMFAGVIIGLDSIKLIKEEDVGDYYTDADHENVVRPPDFRIVRNDDEQLLVEVKNVAPSTYRQVRVDEEALEQERRYAELTGARLVLAHYWSRINQWTVVDPCVLERKNGRLILPFETAAMANELALLGDAMIATEPPLVMSLIAENDRPQRIHKISPTESEVAFTIGDIQISCGGQIITDQLERRIAWFLVLFGRWNLDQEAKLGEDGSVERIDHTLTPFAPDQASIEQIKRQGFAIIGHLSSMYSTLYNAATLTDSGEVQQLRHDPMPGILANLIPEQYWNRPHELPIWKLVTNPSIGPAADRISS